MDHSKRIAARDYYKVEKEPAILKSHKEKIGKQSEHNRIKDARNIFWVLKENKPVKDKITRDIRIRVWK